MGRLILTNDVLTEIDEAQLITGRLDPSPNKEGEVQSVKLATYVIEKCGAIDYIASSLAKRVKKFTHHLCLNNIAKKSVLPSRNNVLSERDFGVLNGTRYSLNSDLFTHTRICAQGGESISECRDRMFGFVVAICQKHDNILIASHPFACQILTNKILNHDHTLLTEFWFQKASFIVLRFDKNTGWKFKDGYHAISEKKYSEEEIYSRILKTKGS